MLGYSESVRKQGPGFGKLEKKVRWIVTEQEIDREMDVLMGEMRKLTDEAAEIGIGPGSGERALAHQRKCDALQEKIRKLSEAKKKLRE